MLFRNIKFMPIETVNRAKIIWLCFKSVDYGTRLPGFESYFYPLLVG